MGNLERAFWPAALSLAYVCAAAWQSAGTRLGLSALLALPALLFGFWRWSTRVGIKGDAHSRTIRACLRSAGWGALIWTAAQVAPAGRPAFEALANWGAAVATVAACIALARIPPAGGMLRPPASAQSLDAAMFSALIWGVAIAVPLARVVVPGPGVWLDPLAVDTTTTTAAVASLLVLMASAWRIRLSRRLELGVMDRASGALALATTAFATSVPAAAADIAAPDRILLIAAIAAAMAVIGTVAVVHASSVARVLRITVAVMMLGVPLALTAATLANTQPKQGALAVLVSSVLCVGVGLLAQLVAQPLGPERSRWLAAIDAASRGALEPEPDAALVATLHALEKANSNPTARCEIWRRDPERVLSINIAGYLQSDQGQAPQSLYQLAKQEPLCTLRTAVLKALQVRRPEVRPLLAWLETRNAFCLTLILEDDQPIGFILVPQGRRRSPMTMEEAEALHLLASRISALLAVSSALARSREREVEARDHALQLEAKAQQLTDRVASRASSNQAFAQALARQVRSSLYSSAARMAIAHIERASRKGQIILFEVPPGVDAVAWAACAHLAGLHPEGPLVLADATASNQEELFANSQDGSRSPWWLAQGGTLLILNFQALGESGRNELERLLAEARRVPANPSHAAPAGPSEAAPAGSASPTAAEIPEPPGLILAAASLTADLATWASRQRASQPAEPIRLPTLAERPEDLRGLVLEHLARLGSEDPEPLGVEPSCLQALLEHDWPGNDAELKGVVTAAAARCQGARISLADLAHVGFATPEGIGSARAANDSSVAKVDFSSTSRRRRRPSK